MSREFPEVLVLAIGSASCLPVTCRPYVTIDVREKEKRDVPIARTGVVSGTVQDTAWDEEFKFVLKSATESHNNATMTFTVWDADGYHTDGLLGRATLCLQRSPHQQALCVPLSHSNVLPRRSLSITVRTYTASRATLRHPSIHSFTTTKKVDTPTTCDNITNPDSFSETFEVQKASQLLSRKLVSWFANRATRQDAKCKYLIEVSKDLAFKKSAAENRIIDLEGLLVTRGELYRKEVDFLKDNLTECRQEMEAALQALNHTEQTNEDNLLIVRSLKSENKHLQGAIQSLHNQLAIEKGSNIEGAAAELLLSGGSGETLELLASQAHALKSENRLLKIKEVRLAELEKLVLHLTSTSSGRRSLAPQPPSPRRKKSRPGTVTHLSRGLDPQIASDISAVRRELSLL